MTNAELKPEHKTMGTEWAEECDVVVVGSGGGALTAAYTAGVHGLKTQVVEKTALFGGTTTYSGAALWFPGNDIEMDGDPGDSVDLARTYLSHLLDDSAKAHYETYLATGPELVDFLTEHPDINFMWNKFPDYFERPGRRTGGRSIWPAPIERETVGDFLPLVRPALDYDRVGMSHPESPLRQGRSLIASLLVAGRSTGNVDYHVNSPMTELIVEDGQVVGVVVQRAGREMNIRARRGVVIAAGGYESNAEMRVVTDTPGLAEWSMSPAGANTGGPINAAVAIGAATDLMGDAWWSPGAEQPDGRPSALMCLTSGIMVDGSGTRFCNEYQPYDQLGRVMSGNASDGSSAGGTAHDPIYYVFDSREEGRFPAIALPALDPAACLESGVWVCADSVEELAVEMGVPEAALRATIDEFNADAKTGVDTKFGRGEDPYDLAYANGSGPNPALVQLETGPFYAARMVIADFGTKGGLRIDTNGRVLREDNTVIDGLYAAGNSTASMTGHTYPGPGFPIGTSMMFGYLAAKDLAAQD